MIAEYDAELADSNKRKNRHLRGPAVFEAINEAKIKLGPGAIPSKANRLIARDVISRHLVQANHRSTHIVRDLPIAIELVFTPNVAELEAAEFAQDWQTNRRRAMGVSAARDD
jgi:hypothetical protein